MSRGSKSKPHAPGAAAPQATAARAKPLRGDPRIAAIFQDMRKISGLSTAVLAKQLGTGQATIAALERGAIGALPEWTETSRIILAYANLVQIDAGPILRHIATQLAPSRTEQQASAQRAAAARGAAQPAPSRQAVQAKQAAQARPAAAAKPGKQRRRGRGLKVTIATMLIVIVGLGGAGAYVASNPQVARDLMASLPEPAERVIRSIAALFGQSLGAPVDRGQSNPDKLPGDAVTVPAPR